MDLGPHGCFPPLGPRGRPRRDRAGQDAVARPSLPRAPKHVTSCMRSGGSVSSASLNRLPEAREI
eukprot:5882778-Pyramimonas_sp.AAC.1